MKVKFASENIDKFIEEQASDTNEYFDLHPDISKEADNN